jgi:hypothetical protein
MAASTVPGLPSFQTTALRFLLKQRPREQAAAGDSTLAKAVESDEKSSQHCRTRSLAEKTSAGRWTAHADGLRWAWEVAAPGDGSRRAECSSLAIFAIQTSTLPSLALNGFARAEGNAVVLRAKFWRAWRGAVCLRDHMGRWRRGPFLENDLIEAHGWSNTPSIWRSRDNVPTCCVKELRAARRRARGVDGPVAAGWESSAGRPWTKAADNDKQRARWQQSDESRSDVARGRCSPGECRVRVGVAGAICGSSRRRDLPDAGPPSTGWTAQQLVSTGDA